MPAVLTMSEAVCKSASQAAFNASQITAVQVSMQSVSYLVFNYQLGGSWHSDLDLLRNEVQCPRIHLAWPVTVCHLCDTMLQVAMLAVRPLLIALCLPAVLVV